MKTTRIALVSLLGLALALPAAVEARTLGVGAHVGYSDAKNADGTYHIGGNLSLRLAEIVGGLLEVEYRKDDVDVGGGFRGDVDVEYIPILASVQVFPFADRLGAISPYAIGGYGWYVTRTEIRGEVAGINGRFTDYDHSEGWHLGAGADFNLGPNLTLSGDVRWVWLETNFEDIDDVDSDGIRLTFAVKFFL
jgi:opacity protein-like surface antigen